MYYAVPLANVTKSPYQKGVGAQHAINVSLLISHLERVGAQHAVPACLCMVIDCQCHGGLRA